MKKEDNQEGRWSMKIMMRTCGKGGQSGRHVVNEDNHGDMCGRRIIREAGGH